MTEAVIAFYMPAVLEPGEYGGCRRGRSQNQPFRDGRTLPPEP
jgi:CDGSH-type Zn-finger protein